MFFAFFAFFAFFGKTAGQMGREKNMGYNGGRCHLAHFCGQAFQICPLCFCHLTCGFTLKWPKTHKFCEKNFFYILLYYRAREKSKNIRVFVQNLWVFGHFLSYKIIAKKTCAIMEEMRLLLYF